MSSPLLPSEEDRLVGRRGSDDLSEDEEGVMPSHDDSFSGHSWRNLIAFWLLGLCNNYAYVIMLSAAHDVLSTRSVVGSSADDRRCNPTSAGAILLADVLPGLITKTVSPVLRVYTHVRVMLVVALSALSFVLVAASTTPSMTYLGVVCASISAGLGEVTLLSYSASFHQNVVSTWSSGTGFSGVLGSFSYAALTTAGLSMRATLLLMLLCPVTMAATYTFVMEHPPHYRSACQLSSATTTAPQHQLQWTEQLALLGKMPAYMLPLGMVYFFEYFINQGLLELIWFKHISLDHSEQYRWLQVAYQVGVFVSRSSVNVIRVKRIWMLAVLQGINAVFFLLEADYMFVRSFWPLVVLVLWEGLLGGAAYVNTFTSIYSEVADRERSFFLGTVSLADSAGIAMAGAVSLPVHNALCKLPYPKM